MSDAIEPILCRCICGDEAIELGDAEGIATLQEHVFSKSIKEGKNTHGWDGLYTESDEQLWRGRPSSHTVTQGIIPSLVRINGKSAIPGSQVPGAASGKAKPGARAGSPLPKAVEAYVPMLRLVFDTAILATKPTLDQILVDEDGREYPDTPEGYAAYFTQVIKIGTIYLWYQHLPAVFGLGSADVEHARSMRLPERFMHLLEGTPIDEVTRKLADLGMDYAARERAVAGLEALKEEGNPEDEAADE